MFLLKNIVDQMIAWFGCHLLSVAIGHPLSAYNSFSAAIGFLLLVSATRRWEV